MGERRALPGGAAGDGASGPASRAPRVQSIDRAFAILEALGDGPLGVSEIARRVGLPKSSTARILGALRDQKAVEQMADGKYHVGPRLRRLARGLQPAQRLVTVARPFLVELAETSGETAMIGLPDGHHTLFIEQVEARHEIRIRDWTGARVPMHQTAGGQVLLTSLDDVELAAYVAEGLEQATLATITDRNVLRVRLRTVVEAGYAWVAGEAHEGVTSVAAGVADESGRLVCCLSLHGPSFRFPPAGQKAAIGRMISEAATRMSAVLRGES
ncbi:MAG: IclR family transcriptional regulator [Chloroflexota bacterium]